MEKWKKCLAAQSQNKMENQISTATVERLLMLLIAGALKMREWKIRSRQQWWKMWEWKMRKQIAGVKMKE